MRLDTRLQNARIQHPAERPSPVHPTDHSTRFLVWPVLACLAISMAFMAVAALLYWPTPELAFASDNSPVSWLSGVQLWALALLSLRLTIDRTLPLLVGVWLALAMTALAFDEQFLVHEQWKYGCHEWWNACRHHWVTEAPTIMVGVAGTATVLVLHGLLPTRSAQLMLWSALSVGGLALALDLFGWPRPLAPYEEGLEIIAETLFTGVLLGWLAPARTQVHSP